MTRAPMHRRSFLTLLGASAAAWPLAASAQQAGAAVVGYLYGGVPEGSGSIIAAAFRSGLSEAGYIEGRNVMIEYRWGQNDITRLPELAADLVRRRVAMIAAPAGLSSALAARAATTTIPIVFGTAGDPVQAGLVASLNRPGGNVTGATGMDMELWGKRFGLLHELLPNAQRFGMLASPANPNAQFLVQE